MSYRRVASGLCDFSLHLEVDHSVLCQLEGVGHVFSNHHISKCSGPPVICFKVHISPDEFELENKTTFSATKTELFRKRFHAAHVTTAENAH